MFGEKRYSGMCLLYSKGGNFSDYYWFFLLNIHGEFERNKSSLHIRFLDGKWFWDIIQTFFFSMKTKKRSWEIFKKIKKNDVFTPVFIRGHGVPK